MKKYLYILIVLTFASCNAQDISKDFKEGETFLNQNDFQKALLTFNKIIEKDPNNPNNLSAYLLRSKAKYGLKDYKGSVEDNLFFIKDETKLTKEEILIANWNLGVCYNNLKDYEIAKKYLRSAKILDDKDIRIYESMGYSYLELNQLDSAIWEFESLLKIDSKYKKGYYGIGKAKLGLAKYNEAINEFDKAIQIDTNYAIAYQNRGAAKFEIGDKVGGCKDWQKCLELGITAINPYLEQMCK